jgi:hypothetical protein
MGAATFFGRLAALMADNPPADADAPALERFASIGLTVRSFDPDRDLAEDLEQGRKAAIAALRTALAQPAAPVHGWSLHRGLGSYGTDYTRRALVAMAGLGANLDQDSIYPHTSIDGEGEPLNGARRYVLRFGRGETLPARAFWSLTMSNERQYFVANPLDRYAIGDRDPLVFNADGSLEISLQHDTPGRERSELAARARGRVQRDHAPVLAHAGRSRRYLDATADRAGRRLTENRAPRRPRRAGAEMRARQMDLVGVEPTPWG